jgi:hypothetical protein
MIVGLITGGVMGWASVILVRNLTEGMDFEKRCKLMLFVGIPLGCITGVLAQYIGTHI